MLARLVKLSFHSCGLNETDHDDDDEKQIDINPSRYARLHSSQESSEDEWSSDDEVDAPAQETRGLLHAQTRKGRTSTAKRQVRTIAEAETYLIQSIDVLLYDTSTPIVVCCALRACG
jgi:hypothetical protein